MKKELTYDKHEFFTSSLSSQKKRNRTKRIDLEARKMKALELEESGMTSSIGKNLNPLWNAMIHNEQNYIRNIMLDSIRMSNTLNLFTQRTMKKELVQKLLDIMSTSTMKDITPQKMQKAALEYTWLKNEFRCLKEAQNEKQKEYHIQAINHFFDNHKDLFEYIHAPYKEYYYAMKRIEAFLVENIDKE